MASSLGSKVDVLLRATTQLSRSRSTYLTCRAQKHGLESLALPKDSPVVKGDEVHEMPIIPSLRRPGTLRWGEGTRRSSTEHEDAARKNTAGRVMLRAYRRGPGPRVQPPIRDPADVRNVPKN
jgi:hypothetical protein